jgi:homoserine O-succinyltransferase
MVFTQPPSPGQHRFARGNFASAPAPRGENGEASIVVGLVNNMPDGALAATERQFRDLLAAASPNSAITFRVFSIPEIHRGEVGRHYIRERCEPIERLWDSRIDGLIVTGTEPHASALADEPYWPAMARLVDWAESHTTSSIWSCLAAHAAVLHKDGIRRRRRPEKLTGLFECVKVSEHELLNGTPARCHVPHSRYNELPAEALASSGYEILLRSPQAGADMFVKQRRSLFIFFQGHPEYDADTLLREFRRDIGRFIDGQRDSYPAMPEGYFDGEGVAALDLFRNCAVQKPCIDLHASFPTMAAARGLRHSWRDCAVRIYRNWVGYLRGRSPRIAGRKSSIAQADELMIRES